MDPNIRQPYSESWNFSIQRELGRSRVLEVRYNGNRTVHQWMQISPNEVNIFENGFLAEFKKAQANLALGGGKTFSDVELAQQDSDHGCSLWWCGNSKLLSNAVHQLPGQRSSRDICQPACRQQRKYSFVLLPSRGYELRTLRNQRRLYRSRCGLSDQLLPGESVSARKRYELDDGRRLLQLQRSSGRSSSGQWHGLQGDFNYVWSKSLGLATANGNYTAAGASLFTLRNLRLSYVPTSFDIQPGHTRLWNLRPSFWKGKSLPEQWWGARPRGWRLLCGHGHYLPDWDTLPVDWAGMQPTMRRAMVALY